MSQINLHNLIWGVQVAGIVKSALELHLFDALNTAPGASVEQVAREIGADTRGTRILLDAVNAIGLVERHDNNDNGENGSTYQLTTVAQQFLVRSSQRYVGDTMQMLNTQAMWQGYERLSEAVRAGGSVLDEHAEDPQFTHWDGFAQHTVGLARQGGRALSKLLGERLPVTAPLRVLDLACGTGLYGRSLAEQFSCATVTFLDWERVLAYTRKNTEALAQDGRARYLAGDMFTTDLRGPYDLIITSHVFHHFDDERSGALMRRLADAMRPGGMIAVHDFVISEAPPSVDPGPYLFATTMLASTRRGDTYTSGRFARLLSAAGYATPEEVTVSRMPTRFLFAERLALAERLEQRIE